MKRTEAALFSSLVLESNGATKPCPRTFSELKMLRYLAKVEGGPKGSARYSQPHTLLGLNDVG